DGGCHDSARPVTLILDALLRLPAAEPLITDAALARYPQLSEELRRARDAALEKGALTSPRFSTQIASANCAYCASVMSSASASHSVAGSNSTGSSFCVTSTMES